MQCQDADRPDHQRPSGNRNRLLSTVPRACGLDRGELDKLTERAARYRDDDDERPHVADRRYDREDRYRKRQSFWTELFDWRRRMLAVLRLAIRARERVRGSRRWSDQSTKLAGLPGVQRSRGTPFRCDTKRCRSSTSMIRSASSRAR